jgi:Protein of unknown function (DUF4239)
MFYWIYDIPTWQLTLLVSGFFVGLSWFGSVFVRPHLRPVMRSQPDCNGLVGNILSCFCVFYGLLLGLISVAAYENFNQVETTVTQEAASLAALYRDATTYPDPIRGELQAMLRDYCRYVIDQAWPAQRKGLVLEGGTLRFTAFHRRLASFEPATKGQEIIHAETLRQFNQLIALRRMRVFNVTTGIPPVMWYVVFIGAFINILIIWMFDMNLAAHLILGGLLSFFIGSVISLMAAMDNPFRGEVSVAPDAFVSVYESLMAPSMVSGSVK